MDTPQSQEQLKNIIFFDQSETISELISNGLNVNFCFDDGHSLLLTALLANSEDTALMLIKKSADLFHKHSDGSDILMLASKYECPKIATLLIQQNFPLNCFNTLGESALSIAIMAKQHNVILCLLKKMSRLDIEYAKNNNKIISQFLTEFETNLTMIKCEAAIHNLSMESQSTLSLHAAEEAPSAKRKAADDFFMPEFNKRRKTPVNVLPQEESMKTDPSPTQCGYFL